MSTSKMRKIEKNIKENSENFFLRRHFDDFEELAESTQGWNLEFQKLDKNH